MAVKKKRTHEPSDQVPNNGDEVRYAISLVRQGENRFYTLTMPSNVLSACSFVTTKDENPKDGFQRVLDKQRAKEIANYVDSGGSIPNSIVLSAQPDANFRSVDRAKTAAFTFSPYAFLVIDGQHRAYGFSLAKTVLRVPVVIYDGLTKDQEAKLFIDINTKQKPVPKELLLAIKSLANSESDIETRLGQVFDLFHQDRHSALLGMTSSTKKIAGKIDRVTFNAGLRAHLEFFDGREVNFIYSIWNPYFHAVISGLREKAIESALSKKTTFRAFCAIFPDVVQRVQDKYKGRYSSENFSQVLSPVFRLTSNNLSKPATIDGLADDMRRRMRSGLSL